MKKVLLITIMAVSLSMSGCVISIDDGDYDNGYSSHSSWKEEQRENRKHIARLSLGESKDDVLNKMGKPAFNEALQKDASDYQLLWYRTQHVDSDGVTTKDECTPLIFKSNELIGWGDTALDLL